jgi:hypothetical protein
MRGRASRAKRDKDRTGIQNSDESNILILIGVFPTQGCPDAGGTIVTSR